MDRRLRRRGTRGPSPSVLAVAVAAAGVYRLALLLTTGRGAWIAAVLFVALPRVAFNGIEARSYALTTAVTVWAAFWTVRAACDGRWWRWMIVSALSGLAAATFLYAVLVLPAFAVLAYRTGLHRRRAMVGSVAASTCAVVLASPVALVAAGEGSQIAWLRSQPVNVYTVAVETFFLQAWWMAVIALIVCVVAVVRRRVRHTNTLLLVAAAWVLLPLVTLLLGSALASPMFTPRYLSMTTPVVAIVLGAAVASWRSTTSVLITAALVLGAFPSLVSMRTVTGKPGVKDLRGTAELIATRSEPGDGFYLGNRGTVSLRPRTTVAAYPAAFSDLQDVARARPYYENGSYSDSLVDDEAAVRRADHLRRIWVVAPLDKGEPFADALEAGGWRVGGEWDRDSVAITLLVARPRTPTAQAARRVPQACPRPQPRNPLHAEPATPGARAVGAVRATPRARVAG